MKKIDIGFIDKCEKFLLADGHASYSRKYFNRKFEVYKGYTEDDLINEFTGDCIFFLKNPEMIDKLTLFNPKTWVRWFLNGLGWQKPLEKYKNDLAKKRIRKSG